MQTHAGRTLPALQLSPRFLSNPRSVMPKEPRKDPLSHLLQPFHAFAVNLSTWNIPSATTQSLGSFKVFRGWKKRAMFVWKQKAPTKTMGHGEFLWHGLKWFIKLKNLWKFEGFVVFPSHCYFLWWIYFIKFYYIIWSLSVYPTANQHWRFRWNAWNHHFVNLCAGMCLS